jgi:hypothetical protein
MGVHGGLTNLVNFVTHQVVTGWLSHMAGRPCGSAFTALALPFSCGHMCMKVAGQTDIKPGQL